MGALVLTAVGGFAVYATGIWHPGVSTQRKVAAGAVPVVAATPGTSPAVKTPIQAAPVAMTPPSTPPEVESRLTMADHLKGAPYYFTNVNSFLGVDGDPICALTLRRRVSLDQCADKHVVAAARVARHEIGGPDGSTAAAGARGRIVALTKCEPDCYTGWEWFAEVSFLLNRTEDFQRAFGQMVALGLHECVKQETWMMVRKALLRHWLEPFFLNLHRPDIDEVVGCAFVAPPDASGQPGLFVFEDYESQPPDAQSYFAVFGSPQILYVGAAKDHLPDGFGVAIGTAGTYRGEFQQFKRHGWGIWSSSEGLTISGRFEDNHSSDPWMAMDRNGWLLGETSEGGPVVWKADSFLFRGTLAGGHIHQGFLHDLDAKRTYAGNFFGLMLDGYGVITFADGKRLEGEFKAGVPTHRTRVLGAGGAPYYWVRDEGNKQLYRAADGSMVSYPVK